MDRTQRREREEVLAVQFKVEQVYGNPKHPYWGYVNDAIQDLVYAEEQVERAAVQLQDDMGRVIDKIREGYHLNPLGEVQGRGADVDRAVALRQERITSLHRLAHLVQNVQPA